MLVDDLNSEIVDELHVGRIIAAEPVRNRGGIVQTDKGERGDAEHHEQNQSVPGGDTNEEWHAGGA